MMATQIDYVADWQERIRSRLYAQFRDMPNLQALADLIAAEAQQFEDAAQASLSIASANASTGAQLQLLGRLIGQPWASEMEPAYRLRIQARIKANRSSGTSDELYGVFLAMLGLTGPGHAQVVPLPPGPAAILFRVLDVMDAPVAAVLLDFLYAAKVGGTRLVLEWSDALGTARLLCDDAAALLYTDANPTGLGDLAAPMAGGVLAGALAA